MFPSDNPNIGSRGVRILLLIFFINLQISYNQLKAQEDEEAIISNSRRVNNNHYCQENRNHKHNLDYIDDEEFEECENDDGDSDSESASELENRQDHQDMEERSEETESAFTEKKKLDSKSLIEFVLNMDKEPVENPSFYESLENLRPVTLNRSMPLGTGDNSDFLGEFLSNYFQEDNIVDDIATGIEESLTLSDDQNLTSSNNSVSEEKEEKREFALYMFQGQYSPEPRLNRFIDGAVGIMTNEITSKAMDPLYFRVLKKGRVVSRGKPNLKLGIDKIRKPVKRKRPGQGQKKRKRRPGQRRRRRRPGILLGRKRINEKVTRIPKMAAAADKLSTKPNVNGNGSQRSKGQNHGNLNQLRKQKQDGSQRRTFLTAKRRKAAAKRNRIRAKKQRQQNRRKKQKQQQRKRKRANLNGVGSGRVVGLSKIERDGDVELQQFGNYTMVRSHQKVGPITLNMRFRTRRGFRSTGATLPVLKIHTVTRLNPEGSEMVDFVLDRPHPETIELRGRLFPLAQRVARNIFARLFHPRSFLVARIRQKIGVAMHSKPRSTTAVVNNGLIIL